jgi:hypothetical protein
MTAPGRAFSEHAMTRERQHAMAQYEEARIRYRQAVLGSLGGSANGDAIREAIRALQVARAELARLEPVPRAAVEVPARDTSPRWSLFRRLLTVS